jgi:hypothetical protein
MGAICELKVLDPNGHSSTTWDSTDQDQVETARRIFNELTRQGYRAFRMERNSTEGTPKRTFDPKDEETLLVPPIRAG